MGLITVAAQRLLGDCGSVFKGLASFFGFIAFAFAFGSTAAGSSGSFFTTGVRYFLLVKRWRPPVTKGGDAGAGTFVASFCMAFGFRLRCGADDAELCANSLALGCGFFPGVLNRSMSSRLHLQGGMTRRDGSTWAQALCRAATKNATSTRGLKLVAGLHNKACMCIQTTTAT